MRFSRLLGLAAVMFHAVASAPVQAADYPTRPVTIIVPYAPGGPTDTCARIVAQALQKQTGGVFLVENAPGAGPTIGASRAAKATPDGYTFLWGGLSTHAIAPHLYPRLPYDGLTSFDPISMIGSQPYVLVVNSNSPHRTVAELLAEAKSTPGKLNYSSPGNGSAPHLTTELFLNSAKIKVQHVPYKGGSPAMTALIAGEVDFFIDTPTLPIQHIQAGRVRPLAVTSAQRLPELPDVPTLRESGLAGFEATTWFGLFAPRGTPPDIIDRVSKMVNAALKDPEVLSKVSQMGLNAMPSTPAQLAKTVKTEHEKWGQIIKQGNIRLQ